MIYSVKILKRRVGIIVLILSTIGPNVFAKDWKKIVPCVTTRFEAERVLGRDDSPSNVSIYKHKEFRVHIEYNENENDPNRDIVEVIEVYPEKSITLRSYVKKIPAFLKKYRKTTLDDRITHVSGRAIYRDWNEGFGIWVQKNEENAEVITSFVYFDPKYSCSKILPSSAESNTNNFQELDRR